jgi:fluoride exporter
MWINYAAIAIGGAIGACLRFAMSEAMLHLFGRAFPFGTLLVNILGSFTIGLLYGLILTEQLAPNPWRIFIGIGILGIYHLLNVFYGHCVDAAARALISKRC